MTSFKMNLGNNDFWEYFDLIPGQKKFWIRNFFSRFDQIRGKLQICSYLLRKSLTENFIFCAESFLWIWSHLQKKSLMQNFIFLRTARRISDYSWAIVSHTEKNMMTEPSQLSKMERFKY